MGDSGHYMKCIYCVQRSIGECKYYKYNNNSALYKVAELAGHNSSRAVLALNDYAVYSVL